MDEWDTKKRQKRSSLDWNGTLCPVDSKSLRCVFIRSRLLLSKVLRAIAKPWLLSLLFLLAFFGFVVNGYTRILQEQFHCINKRNRETEETSLYSRQPAVDEDRMTLMLNSFHRPDLMKLSIDHYSRCRSVLHQIRVIWCEGGDPPMFETENGMKIVYDVMNGTSLNNRFSPVPGLETEAVMSIDDDIYATCWDLRKAFETWRRHKKALVGFFPRSHSLDEECRYEYHLGTKTYVEGRYSIILTKAAVFHRNYLTIYSDIMPQEIRDYVDDKHNCEDIAMQLLVSNSTSESAQFVNSPWVTDTGKGPLGVTGISSGIDHKKVRTECLNDLVPMFDYVPLVSESLDSDGESMLWIRLSQLFSMFLNLLT